MNTTYNGIEISYDENDSKFKFMLRNRERSYPTLREAKELIDRPVKEKTTFKRITCWHREGGWSKRYVKVEVTSVAEAPKWRSRNGEEWVWTVDASGKREKLHNELLFPVNSKNDPIIEELHRAADAITALEKQKEALAHTLDTLAIVEES